MANKIMNCDLVVLGAGGDCLPGAISSGYSEGITAGKYIADL